MPEIVPESILRQRLHKLLVDKLHRAGWQTNYLPSVTVTKRVFLMQHFGVRSSRDLRSRDLHKACSLIQNIAIKEPHESEYMRLTIAQRKKIIAIGFKLSEHYGNPKWTFKKLAEWTTEFYRDTIHQLTGIDLTKRRVRRIEDLTKAEAHYIIQRMEKIEYSIEVNRK